MTLHRGFEMALTRNFKETVKNRIERDPIFREELLMQGIECLLVGDMDTGKAILRDYINATIGFDALGTVAAKSPKSLMRLLKTGAVRNSVTVSSIVGYHQS